MRLARISTILLALTLATSTHAQAPGISSAPVSVYLDCDFSGCDFDYFRTELTMVDWVRDRQVADVHILVASQPTGIGGREYDVHFIGLRRFAGLEDTLKFISAPQATQDERRTGLARVFRMGLVRYLARTPAESRITVTYKVDTSSAPALRPKDPWNAWVFETRLQAYASGEKTYDDYNLYGTVRADRVTARWKTRLNVYESYNQSEYEIDPAQPRFVNIRRNYGTSLMQAKALGAHWSAGGRFDISSSTYENSARVIRVFPAIEYDLFPYKESTRRQLVFEYDVGFADYTYRDTTINEKLRESMPLHRLLVGLEARQPWGSIELSTRGTHYFNGRGEYHVSTFTGIDVRLFKGFSVNGYGGYDIIRDQFSLAKRNFTQQEILTRQYRRGSPYSFWTSFSIQYRFGSSFNNVVNPRMEGF